MSFISGLGFHGDYDASAKFSISIRPRVVWRGEMWQISIV